MQTSILLHSLKISLLFRSAILLPLQDQDHFPLLTYHAVESREQTDVMFTTLISAACVSGLHCTTDDVVWLIVDRRLLLADRMCMSS